MEFDPQENKMALAWFVVAGFCAVCLSFFLFNVDKTITNSEAEKIRGEEMREVRQAQSSFIAESVDPRITYSQD